MRDFSIITTTDWTTCQEIWEKFSPHQAIDDEWNFRLAYAEGEHTKAHFLTVLNESEEVIALFALQKNQSGVIEVFGGAGTDDNHVFGDQSPEVIEALLAHLSHGVDLWPLGQPYSQGETIAVEDDAVYTLPIGSYENSEAYMHALWSPDTRRVTQNRLRKLEKDYKIEIFYNRYEDIDRLFELNIETYGDYSIFVRKPYRMQLFKDFLEQFTVDMLSIEVDGIIQAVSYTILHKGVYIAMNHGASRAINNLGKYLNLAQIERAIALGCTVYDAGKSNRGEWKTAFKFTPTPQYRFKRD